MSLTQRIAKLDPAVEIDWNHREAVTARFSDGWAYFMRATTNERWWFRVTLRARKGAFTRDGLRKMLALPVWDDVK